MGGNLTLCSSWVVESWKVANKCQKIMAGQKKPLKLTTVQSCK